MKNCNNFCFHHQQTPANLWGQQINWPLCFHPQATYKQQAPCAPLHTKQKHLLSSLSKCCVTQNEFLMLGPHHHYQPYTHTHTHKYTGEKRIPSLVIVRPDWNSFLPSIKKKQIKYILRLWWHHPRSTHTLTSFGKQAGHLAGALVVLMRSRLAPGPRCHQFEIQTCPSREVLHPFQAWPTTRNHK